jgi:glycosyltransferase involved in cell wall biosynthesis
MSSGYAGFLGALASRLHHAPLLLSVHGADLTERIEGIRRSARLAPPPGLTAPFAGNLGPCKSLWIGFFELLGRLACTRAERVTAPCQSQARVLIELGAPPQHVTVIPNGIDAMRFASIARKKLQEQPAHERRITVGFLGRLVPVKDIKTLLRAARLVLKAHPETRFLLAGPHDADPEYFAECRALAERTGISQSVEFPGPMSSDAFLRRCDIVTLTSIDEGMPFAILEASAAGLPVVAPDVGACRKVIVAQLPGHPTLGPSGFITEVASPVSTANALKQLVASADLRFEQGMNGLRRVQSAYRQEFIVDRYHKLYHALAASPAALGPAGT